MEHQAESPTQRERMRVLRVKHVRELTGLDDVTIWRLETQGQCPRRFKLHDNGTAVGWLQGEWLDWIAARASERVTLKAPKREAAAA